MNGTYNLDLEKLNKSVETISGIEDCISSRDLSEGFSNLENYFRDINFEHGNCLKYKEDLELIYSDIDQIKRKISNLADALITTTENYGDIESLTSKDIKELTGVYNSTPSSENLGSLVGEANQLRKNLATDLTPPSSTTQQTTNPQTYNQPTTGVQDPNIGITNGSSGGVTSVPAPEEPIDEYTTKTINTVPIGIAIGATGIVGSIGAVVVNEKYGRKNKNKELEEVDDDVFDNDNDDNYYQKDEENIEYDASPYMASRQQREADRYYGNEIRLEEDDDFKEADKDKGDYYE